MSPLITDDQVTNNQALNHTSDAVCTGWFEWALRVNTTVKGNNIWGFANCYQLGYLKYADLYGIPA